MPPSPICHLFHDLACVKALAAALKRHRVSVCPFKILSVIFIPPLLPHLLECSNVSSAPGSVIQRVHLGVFSLLCSACYLVMQLSIY